MDILMLKSILTTVILLMAILQGLSMLQIQGRIRLVEISGKRLRLFHKAEGDVTLLLIFLTAYLCVSLFSVDSQDPRVVLHALFGLSAMVTILLKFALARFFRSYLKYAPYISAVLFLSILGIFFTSALWYFIALVI